MSLHPAYHAMTVLRLPLLLYCWTCCNCTCCHQRSFTNPVCDVLCKHTLWCYPCCCCSC
jgi:hypothetical protein